MPHRRQAPPATNQPPFDLPEHHTSSVLLSNPTAGRIDHLSMLPSLIPSTQASLPWIALCGEHPSFPTPKTGSLHHRRALRALPTEPCHHRRSLTGADEAAASAATPRLGWADPYFGMGCQPRIWPAHLDGPGKKPLRMCTIVSHNFRLIYSNESKLLRFIENSLNPRKIWNHICYLNSNSFYRIKILNIIISLWIS
jgi:hypothetical protein